jgi:3-oxoacyl-[acyl-carrier-protein] synthase-1
MAGQITPGVYAVATDITSSLGMGTSAHWQSVANGVQGFHAYENNGQTYYAARLSNQQWTDIQSAITTDTLTRFEKLCLFSANKAIAQLPSSFNPDETVMVLSTTKGNIDRLNEDSDERTLLHTSAQIIAEQLGIAVSPVVVSHACVSGSVALLYAQRLLTSGRYKNAVVTGCDLFTPFVLNGFLSFQAIAGAPCRPFDADRTGINLGEAAATIILSTMHHTEPLAQLMGGATSNDANHISGPSRTGEELAMAISRAMDDAKLQSPDINMISAHGTATAYNDEMEAKAIHLSGMSGVPLHSMKSYTGHTLGAAGVLESAMIIEAIRLQQLIPSANYEKHGVSVPVNITTAMQPAEINYVLKTASGFGGSNAAIIWAKA